MERLVEEVYLTARRDSHEARRWSVLLLAALAYLCTLCFGYVKTSHQQRQAQDELRWLGDRMIEVNAVADSFAQLETISRDFEKGLRNSLTEVRTEFDGLGQMVGGVVNPSSAEAHRSGTARMQGAAPVIQSDPGARPADRPGGRLPAFTPAQTAAILAARRTPPDMDAEKLRSALADYVRPHILEPWFATINDLWRQQVRRIDGVCATSLTDLQRLQQALVAAGPDDIKVDTNALEQMITELENTRKDAAALKFSPPQEENWWATVTGKRFVVSEIGETAGRSIEDLVNRQEPLDRLAEELQRACDAHASLVARLKDEEQRKRQEIEKLLAQIGQQVKPLEFIALDPDLMSKSLPLLLGAALGGLLYWNARCERRLAASRRALSGGGPGEADRDLPQILAACDTGHLPWRWLTGGAVAWVTAVGLGLVCLLAAGRPSVLLMTIVGAMMVIAAARMGSR